MDAGDVVHAYNEILFIHERKEVLPFVRTWVNLGVTMLNEISQTEKDCMLSIKKSNSNFYKRVKERLPGAEVWEKLARLFTYKMNNMKV